MKRLRQKEMKSAPPSRPTINSIVRKFETTGNVADAHRCGCPVTKSGDDMKDNVENILHENANTSVRRLSLATSSSIGTVHKTLKKLLFKPDIPRLFQKLS